MAVIIGGFMWVQTGKEPVGGVSSTFKTVSALSSVTMTATSSPIEIKGASKVTLLLSGNVAGTGSAIFNVDGSIDGSTFIDFNKLIDNVANTNAQELTRLSGKTITATTTGYMLSLDLTHEALDSFIVTANLATTSGAIDASVKALVEY